MDVFSLHQAGPLNIISNSNAQEKVNSPLNSKEADRGLDLEGSDLSVYLCDRAEIEVVDAGLIYG